MPVGHSVKAQGLTLAGRYTQAGLPFCKGRGRGRPVGHCRGRQKARHALASTDEAPTAVVPSPPAAGHTALHGGPAIVIRCLASRPLLADPSHRVDPADLARLAAHRFADGDAGALPVAGLPGAIPRVGVWWGNAFPHSSSACESRQDWHTQARSAGDLRPGARCR